MKNRYAKEVRFGDSALYERLDGKYELFVQDDSPIENNPITEESISAAYQQLLRLCPLEDIAKVPPELFDELRPLMQPKMLAGLMQRKLA